MSHITPILRTNLRSVLLIAVLGIAVILSFPVAFPDLMHGFHAAHILLHMGGMILALFITILAALSYSALRSRRLLLTTVAFGNFMFTESLLLAYAVNPAAVHLGDSHISEIGHLLMFVTLGLLALGVVQNE